MRTLHACAFVAASTFAVACGGGDAKPDAAPIIIPDAAPDAPPPPIDAQQFDFTCMNNPAPTTAPATIVLSGTATDITLTNPPMQVPVAGATVKGFKGSPPVPVGTPTTTDAAGNWTLTLATGTTPLDGFVEASKSTPPPNPTPTNRTARIYPPQPLVADQAMIPIPLFATDTFAIIVQVSGQTQSDANGTVALLILDCAGTPVSGATISVKQNGTEVGSQQDAGQLQAGAWFVFDVPPGDAVVGATVQGMNLRSHTINVAAKTTSGTIVNPGFPN
jgi:hypothetical protein